MDGAEDGGADHRPGRHAQEGQRADDAERAGPRRSAEQVGCGSRANRDQDAATERLDDPGRDQLVEVLGGPGQRGTDDEQGQRGDEQTPGSPQVGQPAGQRHGQDVDQQVAVDDPARLAQLDPGRGPMGPGQVGQDRRQGDRRHHQLEAGQEDPRTEHGEQHVRRTSVHHRSVVAVGGGTEASRRERTPPSTNHQRRHIPSLPGKMTGCDRHRASLMSNADGAVGIADCERLQTQWFMTGADAAGGAVIRDGPLTWTWLPANSHAILLFPSEIPPESLRRSLGRVVGLGAPTIGAWLDLDVDAAALADAGFERGWSPWWMAAPVESIGPAVDRRVALEDDTPEYNDPGDLARLAMCRARPQTTWHAAARVGGRLAGHGWINLDGDVAGVFNMAVWPTFRRRGLGTGIVRLLAATAATAGASQVALNATPDGERLHSTIGFARIGDGITWWLHR